MDEDRKVNEENVNEENKETIGRDTQAIRLGLEASDAADYDVNSNNISEDVYGLTYAGSGGRHGKGKGRGKIITAFILGMICCLAVIVICTQVLGLARIVSRSDYEYFIDLSGQYGKYYQIMKLIGKDPIAKSDAGTIGDEEIKELVAGIGDPYAQYFTAEEYKEFEKRYLSEYVGIGVGVMQIEDDVMIMRVFEDSPAEEAGFKEGDIIKAVDGEEVTGVDDAIDKISGEAGTPVQLTIDRDGETLTIDTHRDKIEQDSVEYKVYDGHPDVGYIAISTFRKDTAKDFKLAVRDLEAEGCDKFIIDLRDNGGGLTDESLEIADYLLPACRIMTETTKDGKETVHNSKASSADLNCVVLVNGNTASASEILSAAIQDNKAGTIIGSKTYGKGVTQITKVFRDGSAIKITSTEYFRPSGEKVNGVGVTPDIETDDSGAIDKALEVLAK